MIRKGIKPDITIYGIMLHGYSKKGALSEMHDLLNLMVANGISPDLYSVHMLIRQ
jgi:leucine-rich PPR motif-containing protein